MEDGVGVAPFNLVRLQRALIFGSLPEDREGERSCSGPSPIKDAGDEKDDDNEHNDDCDCRLVAAVKASALRYRLRLRS